MRFKIPEKRVFLSLGFFIAMMLIDSIRSMIYYSYMELNHLAEYRIEFYWRKEIYK